MESAAMQVALDPEDGLRSGDARSRFDSHYPPRALRICSGASILNERW